MSEKAMFVLGWAAVVVTAWVVGEAGKFWLQNTIGAIFDSVGV
jgi:hypothetical protein